MRPSLPNNVASSHNPLSGHLPSLGSEIKSQTRLKLSSPSEITAALCSHVSNDSLRTSLNITGRLSCQRKWITMGMSLLDDSDFLQNWNRGQKWRRRTTKPQDQQPAAAVEQHNASLSAKLADPPQLPQGQLPNQAAVSVGIEAVAPGPVNSSSSSCCCSCCWACPASCPPATSAA
jgi:hypothetical protein